MVFLWLIRRYYPQFFSALLRVFPGIVDDNLSRWQNFFGVFNHSDFNCQNSLLSCEVRFLPQVPDIVV